MRVSVGLFGIGVVVLAAAVGVASPGAAQVLPAAVGNSSGPGASSAGRGLPGVGTCGAVMGGAREERKGEAHFPSYLEDSFPQLKAELPKLRGLKFEGKTGGEEGTGTSGTAQQILSEMSESIMAMLPKIPRLVAKEELTETAVRLPYLQEDARPGMSLGGRRGAGMQSYSSNSRGVQGEELESALRTKLGAAGQRTVYSYRIQSDVDPRYGAVLHEYRLDARNELVDGTKEGSGPRAIGFGNSWLLFGPSNLKESRFRYLGQQKVGKHETFVLAFAQVPEAVSLPAQISMNSKACRYYEQGVVWVDQTQFQIVRLQTDLLAALPDIELKELRSEVDFSEVRIPERNLSLWLPSEVEILWELESLAAGERHRYTNYRLFTATSRIVLPETE